MDKQTNLSIKEYKCIQLYLIMYQIYHLSILEFGQHGIMHRLIDITFYIGHYNITIYRQNYVKLKIKSINLNY
jgi:hypothetical protein